MEINDKLKKECQDYLSKLRKGFYWPLLPTINIIAPILLNIIFFKYSYNTLFNIFGNVLDYILLFWSVALGIPIDRLGKKIYYTIVNQCDIDKLPTLIKKRAILLKLLLILPLLMVVVQFIILFIDPVLNYFIQNNMSAVINCFYDFRGYFIVYLHIIWSIQELHTSSHIKEFVSRYQNISK